MLGQGEPEFADPVPFWVWVLRRTLIPSLLPELRKYFTLELIFSAHFPLFNPCGLAEAFGGSGVFKRQPCRSPGSAPFRIAM